MAANEIATGEKIVCFIATRLHVAVGHLPALKKKFNSKKYPSFQALLELAL